MQEVFGIINKISSAIPFASIGGLPAIKLLGRTTGGNAMTPVTEHERKNFLATYL